MQDEFELDERMRDETKKFVVSSLKIVRPSQVPKIDINISRKARHANTLKILETLNFDGLNSREIFVKNNLDNHDIPVSVHVPKEVRPDSPITVFYHGGGWTFGSRDSHYHVVATMASQTKTIWLSVEYRLGPENKFPVQISDCKSVLNWVHKNRAELGNENAKIGVCGDSAGGHYAAILAHEHKDLLDYQILVYPCVDLLNSYESVKEFSKECYILTPEMIEFFARNLLNDHSEAKNPLVSPILNENFSNLPKCLIIAAELDPLVDQSRDYFNKFKENSLECDLKIVKGTIHGFFHNGVFLREAFQEAVQHVLEFLAKF